MQQLIRAGALVGIVLVAAGLGPLRSADAACPAAPVGSVSDTVIQMMASNSLGGIGPVANLDSTREGAVVYDSTSDSIKYCDGTSWNTVGSGSSTLSIGGNNLDVQFNDNGQLQGISGFTFTSGTGVLSVTTVSSTRLSSTVATIVGLGVGSINASGAISTTGTLYVADPAGIGSAPNPTAMLDVASTSRGFLPPRLTTAQRNAITTPPGGLIIFNASANTMEFYDGTTWVTMTGDTATSGAASPTYLAAGYSSSGAYDNNYAFSGGAASALQEVEIGRVFSSLVLSSNNSTAVATWTCGIEEGTNLGYCWGYNGHGQVGDNTTVNKGVPTAVDGGYSWLQLSAGYYTTCGVTTANAGYCWGLNVNGQVGDATTTNRSVPTAVAGSFSWAQISTGGGNFSSSNRGFTCGLTTTGQTYCWGYNGYGQFGNGNTTNRTSPSALTQTSGGYTFSKITTGGQHTCGITTGNIAYCWGSGGNAQLGDGTIPFTSSQIPVQVAGGYQWSSISAGNLHTCGITTSGKMYCWGTNTDGQLGTGNNNTSTPTAVFGGRVWRKVTAALSSTCGITTQNSLYCWGDNVQGQLGDGSGADSNKPVLILDQVTDVEQGGNHVFVRLN